MRPPVRVTPPEKLPVTIEEVRAACRVDDDRFDDQLMRQAQAAVDRLDGYRGRLGRALIHQTWRQDFGFCERGPWRLRFPDVLPDEALAVWRDTDGGETPAAILIDEDVIGSFVTVRGRTGGLSGRLLRVTYVAGYGREPDDVPAAIREAILLDIGHRFQANSEDGQLRSFQVDGAFTESFNSPEQAALANRRMIDDLLHGFRWANV